MLLQRVKFSSFTWPSRIPLWKCPIVAVSTHLLKDTWAASILAIVNSAAMNTEVLMFFRFSVMGFFR